MNRSIRMTVAAFALSCAATAQAGSMGGRGRGPAFLRELFPPSLIMQHQSEIGLTDAQRQAITKEIAEAQQAMLDVRWQLEEKTAALAKLLAAPKIDEPAALGQVDEVLKLEDRMKRLRLGLLIRVKNVLAPEQQEKLRTLEQREPRGGPRGRDRMPPDDAEP